MRRRIGRLLCWFKWHKHPKSYAPAYWQCERPDCDVVQRQEWY